MRKNKTTNEDRVAKVLSDLLSDIRLDLDMIGLYFGRFARLSIYRRLEHIYETARHHRENNDSRESHYENITQ
jgi:hypothetical protein